MSCRASYISSHPVTHALGLASPGKGVGQDVLPAKETVLRSCKEYVKQTNSNLIRNSGVPLWQWGCGHCSPWCNWRPWSSHAVPREQSDQSSCGKTRVQTWISQASNSNPTCPTPERDDTLRLGLVEAIKLTCLERRTATDLLQQN